MVAADGLEPKMGCCGWFCVAEAGDPLMADLLLCGSWWLLREGVAGAAVNHESTLAVMGFVRRLVLLLCRLLMVEGDGS